MRQFIFLPLFAMTACATAANPVATARRAADQSMPSSPTDASVVKWTRLYCTPDNESHFETMSAALGKTNFAPPASPIFIGGGGPASKIVFGGFEPNWGAADVRSGKTHPTPVVQWITVLAGSMVIKTTDGDSRVVRPGDIIHLEDVAPCRGHITHNLSPGATFLQFVQ
ncbi:MAG TPA: hypothetical protein VFU80_06935 [Sphingomicrobium sp.]|nr:hypothetical protein [Sphingomicrobium sp.]